MLFNSQEFAAWQNEYPTIGYSHQDIFKGSNVEGKSSIRRQDAPLRIPICGDRSHTNILLFIRADMVDQGLPLSEIRPNRESARHGKRG